MHKQELNFQFQSILGGHISQFILTKKANGFKYEVGTHSLRRFDRFLCEVDLKNEELSRLIIEQWIARRENEQPGTQKLRTIITRQFAHYLYQQGLSAYIPEKGTLPRNNSHFIPYIFHHHEIQKILNAGEQIKTDSRSPFRHLIMPEIFHLLYSCGMRINEVLHLSIADVDLISGVLRIRDGKFGKDRLIPLALFMTERLKKYAVRMREKKSEDIFFPAPDGGPYSPVTIYSIFRELLRQCNIPHGGRGKGPGLHSFRHTFSVHNLERWYKNGDDMGAKLPLLAAYLGHKSLVGTQQYLRLTPEIFPDINARLEKTVGDIIPQRRIK